MKIQSQKIQCITSVDDTLQTAIRETGLVHDASRLSARMGSATGVMIMEPIALSRTYMVTLQNKRESK